MSTNKVLIFTLTFLLLFSLATYATAAFNPGDTLDPGCSPGDSGCFVEINTTQAIGDTITSATEGSVLFAGASGVFAQDNSSFFFDDSNNRLGIGTATPAATLHSLSATEQLRLGYDASNYLSATVSSSGDTTFDTTGGDFTFSDNIYQNTSVGISLRDATANRDVIIGSPSVTPGAGSRRVVVGGSNTWNTSGNGWLTMLGHGNTASVDQSSLLVVGTYNAVTNADYYYEVFGHSNTVNYTPTTTGRGMFVFGWNNQVLHSSSAVIGTNQVTTAGNQLILAQHQSNCSSCGFNDVYFGNGVRASGAGSQVNNWSGTDVTLNASGAGAADDLNGGDLTLAGGKGTGAGTPGDVYISTASTGGAGSTLQSLTQRLVVEGTSGDVGIGTGTGATASARLHVISTTEQLRLGYNTGAYLSATVGSTGLTTFAATGASGGIRFDENLGVYADPDTTFFVNVNNKVLFDDASSTFVSYRPSSTTTQLNITYEGGDNGINQGYYYNNTVGKPTASIGFNRNYGRLFLGHNIKTGTGIIAGSRTNGEPVLAQAFEYDNGISWYTNTSAVEDTSYGTTTYRKMLLTPAGDLAIGSQVTGASALLHLRKTTEQLRIGYDSDNYISATVNSSGVGAFTTSGTGNTPYFTFSKDISVQSITVGLGPGGVSSNTIVGYQAFNSNTTTHSSAVFGYQAGFSMGATFRQTFFGYQAGYSTTTGDTNIAVGYRALYNNQTGYSNTAIGDQALYNVTSFQNIGIGQGAGKAIGAGQHNVYIGNGAGGSGTTATTSNSVAIGNGALANGASSSVAIGRLALDVVANTTSANIGIGINAGGQLVTGDGNIFIGSSAGGSVTGASNNLYIGNFSGSGYATSSGNIFISEPGGSATVRIHGDSSGNFAIGGSGPSYRLDVLANVASYAGRYYNDGNSTNRSGLLIQAGLDDHTSAGPSTLIGFQDGDGTTVGSITFGSSATAYNTSSDRRLKENIVDTTLSLQTLNEIKIRDYTWIGDTEQKLSHGVIAQELYEIYPLAVTKPIDEETSYWMVDYSKLTPLLVKAVQDIDMKVEASLNLQTNSSFAAKIIAFFANSGNGIGDFFAGRVRTKQLCIGEEGNETCLTKAQIDGLLSSYNPPAGQPAQQPQPTQQEEQEPTEEQEEVVVEEQQEEPTQEEETVVEEQQPEQEEEVIEEEPTQEEVTPEPQQEQEESIQEEV